MKNIYFLILIVLIFQRCTTDKTAEDPSLSKDIHTAVISEVLQTTQYTYLRVKEGENYPWLALPKMDVAVGETYYYKEGMHMTDFASKELNRTFKDILFLDKLSKSPDNLNVETKKEESKPMEADPSMNSENNASSIPHQIKATEVLQTKQYTYIKGKEGSEEIWIAVSKMDAEVGKIYFFQGGLRMSDFPSKELKRTFKEILFVDQIATTASSVEKSAAPSQAETQMVSKGSSIDIEKKEIKIKRNSGDISIASLLKNKDTYSGKTISIKGQVVKFTPGIMKRNWIHLQDGTAYSGKFDLTITTDETVKLGDVINIDGIITLNKDFGFGYFYEVIMENASIKK